MGEDFRGFLKEMEETQEGGFIRIKKEVDRRYEAAAIVKKLELNPNELAGKLDDKNVEDIENAIMKLHENIPDWLLNRQKDYDTGEDIHPVSVDLKMLHDDDLNRMKKVKSYKGIRHASGHKVRGQRTYSNGRKGLALGVSRKKGA